jgi:DNA-binding transcriptional MerR regulator
MSRYLRTSDLAKAVGVHPNTVRRYVDWGLLPPVERSPSGYRRFTQQHLNCLRLARLVYGHDYPGRAIRHSGWEIIQFAVAGDWGGALEKAYQHLALIQAEQAQADAAASLLERWAQGTSTEPTGKSMRIGEVAKLLGLTNDILRNWERNGLLEVPRQPRNGYRLYGPAEISRLRVIRMLVRSGYSLMAILRMLTRLDGGEKVAVRELLDTPRPDEDVFVASDKWLSTLGNEVQKARQIIVMIEGVIGESGETLP